jgi:hypothetical protein
MGTVKPFPLPLRTQHQLLPSHSPAALFDTTELAILAQAK